MTRWKATMAKPFQFRLRTLLLAFMPMAVIALPIGYYLRMPRRVVVSGTVTLDGVPLDRAYILLRPVTHMKISQPIVGTDAAGKFRLGAMPGSYVVLVWNEATNSPSHVTPKRYGDDSMSGLTAQVTPDGPNVFNFN